MKFTCNYFYKVFLLIEPVTQDIKKMSIFYIMIFRLRRQKRTGREQVEERPDGDFRDISVCPTKRDLHITPQIRKNRELGVKLSLSSKLTLGYDIHQTPGKPLELCSNVFLI